MLDFVSREIPRFARNDRLKPFFSNLLDLSHEQKEIPSKIVCAVVRPQPRAAYFSGEKGPVRLRGSLGGSRARVHRGRAT